MWYPAYKIISLCFPDARPSLLFVSPYLSPRSPSVCAPSLLLSSFISSFIYNSLVHPLTVSRRLFLPDGCVVILYLSRHHLVGKPDKLDGQQAERERKEDDWMEASQRSEYSDRERGRLSETSKHVERQKRSQTGKQSN